MTFHGGEPSLAGYAFYISLAKIPSVIGKWIKSDPLFVVSKGFCRMAFVLYELGRKREFPKYIKRKCTSFVKIDEKIALLEQVNQTSLQLYNQRIVPVDALADILIDSAQIGAESASFPQALALLEKYRAMSVFRQNDALYQNVLRQVLE